MKVFSTLSAALVLIFLVTSQGFSQVSQLPTLSINTVQHNEGNSGTTSFTFTVSLSAPAPAGGVTFDIATADGSAVAPGDYTARSLTNQIILAGTSTYSFTVFVNGDIIPENIEVFAVNVSNVRGADVGNVRADGVLFNDDAFADLGVGPNGMEVEEGNSGTKSITFMVTLSHALPIDVTFDIATTSGGTATPGVDFVPQSLTAQVIPAGSTTYSFPVLVNGDVTVEPNEDIIVAVSNVSIGAYITGPSNWAWILNDDYDLTITDVSLSEGNSGTTLFNFDVKLSSPSVRRPVSFEIATSDGTALAPGDYTARPVIRGFINPGSTTYRFTVVVNGDAIPEPDETFFVNVTNAVGANIADGQGQGTIVNDDADPCLTDGIAPVITCPAAQQFCYSSTGTYTIPVLSATDNCSIRDMGYVVSGATTRSGTGNDASGPFTPGISTITWTVEDAAKNVSTCSTMVNINPQILVSIPDSKALNSNGVMANTVYPGYAPASSITLTADASGGSGTYSYVWSNGATTKSITVSPATTTTYTVNVKDGSSCTATASKQVNVTDVRCGNKLDKVSVCHNRNTLCIDKTSVSDHLNHPGDMLGECGNSIVAGRVAASATINEETTMAATVAGVYPNPNKGQFILQLGTTKATRADVQILNAQGAIVSTKTVQTGSKEQTVQLSIPNPVAGTYLVKIISKEGVQILKVLVQP
jgi:hypothetical protein